MAKQKFTHFVPRDKPPKRPRRHKKSLNKSEKDHIKNITDKDEDNMDNKIGENTFLKLRQERDQARDECEKVKIQRDIALRKLNKSLEVAKQLRKIIET